VFPFRSQQGSAQWRYTLPNFGSIRMDAATDRLVCASERFRARRKESSAGRCDGNSRNNVPRIGQVADLKLARFQSIALKGRTSAGMKAP
jgi:hypothetical protein